MRFHLKRSGVSPLRRSSSHQGCNLLLPGAACLGLARSRLSLDRAPGSVQTGVRREPAKGQICEYEQKRISRSWVVGRAPCSETSHCLLMLRASEGAEFKTEGLHMHEGFSTKPSIRHRKSRCIAVGTVNIKQLFNSVQPQCSKALPAELFSSAKQLRLERF